MRVTVGILGPSLTPMTVPLAGRTALITGVSRRRGIGFVVASRLASLGASLALHSHSPHAEAAYGESEDVAQLHREVGEGPPDCLAGQRWSKLDGQSGAQLRGWVPALGRRQHHGSPLWWPRCPDAGSPGCRAPSQ